MNRLRHAWLLLVITGPARADDLKQAYERHKEAAREFSHAVAAVAREREAYSTAGDPEAHLQRWDAQIRRAHEWEEEQKKQWARHDKGLEKTRLSMVTGIVESINSKRDPVSKGSVALFEHENDNDLMRDLQDKHLETFLMEISAFAAAKQQLLTLRENQRRQRNLTRGLLAVAVGAVCAALLWRWISQRRKTIILHSSTARSGPPPIPKLIAGNLEVKGLIGQGAMGEVYEAFDTTIGRRVALKRLRPELLASPADLEGLLTEARVVASLKHENLVAIYSVEREAGQVYLAFEFVDGMTLARSIEMRRRLPWSDAQRIFRSVCSALHYAHDRRVIHRDLKPANIMIARTGEVKVMDFGIAFTAQKSISRLTRAAAWGTPPYMAPEQELGGVSSAVDLFAASVCLYEMLTGELPFKGPNFLAQKREGRHPPPRALVPGLPQGSDSFFASALAPEPSKRFPTAAALAAGAAAVS